MKQSNEETLKEHDKHCDFCKGLNEDRKAEEKLLDDFIMQERMKFRAGSGDDMFYEEQIINYINKPIVNKQIVKYVNEQRAFWLDFIRFIQKKQLPADTAISIKEHEGKFN